MEKIHRNVLSVGMTIYNISLSFEDTQQSEILTSSSSCWY